MNNIDYNNMYLQARSKGEFVGGWGGGGDLQKSDGVGAGAPTG